MDEYEYLNKEYLLYKILLEKSLKLLFEKNLMFMVEALGDNMF